LPDLVFRLMGAIHRPVYRLTGGKVGGKIGASPVLLLTTTGRKTGKPRTQPLLYAPAGDGYAVIASKGGADAHPLWFRNLQANPRVEVTIGRTTRPMHAREAEGDERERLWRALADSYSGYDTYATRTSRRIPVVVLEPESAES
jgi:F420H(2)-dependent quinone reductase